MYKVFDEGSLPGPHPPNPDVCVGVCCLPVLLINALVSRNEHGRAFIHSPPP